MFCSNCGKELRQGANFCMYCGTTVGDIENDLNEEDTEWASYEGTTEEENYGDDEYSNCENGIVSFPKMFRKFFSKDIKEYFSFDGTYSRLEYFYARVIVYIALFAICVPCTAVPGLYMLVAVPLTVAFIWLLASSYIKRLKDLNVTLWVMLIPPVCGLFIREKGINIIAAIILIYYQACILFLQGEKFKSYTEENSKNDEEDNSIKREEEENAEKEEPEKITFNDFFIIFIFGLIISVIILALAKG